MQVLRVDWPVYPRRAEHNTVAEGGNRRLAEANQRTSERRHQRRLTSPPLPSRGAAEAPKAGKSCAVPVQAAAQASHPSVPGATFDRTCSATRSAPLRAQASGTPQHQRRDPKQDQHRDPKSAMIASLVGRFMIKTLHEKGPGLLPGRRPQLVGGP